MVRLSTSTRRDIDRLVNLYKDNIPDFRRVAESVYNLLQTHELITPHVHSLKYRVKDPEHLRHKLIRKASAALQAGEVFDINETNLFEKINDFAGVRILHINTEQMGNIDSALRKIFDAELYKIVEGPIANTWDEEYKKFFNKIKISTKTTDSLYTSVHYVIESNNRAHTKCEIQVRTLMEEVWGEVSHKITYPDPTHSVACQEQIRVLARVTSSGTRLVDSIFKSYNEFTDLNTKIKKAKKQKKNKR